jgi:hypothetical protein
MILSSYEVELIAGLQVSNMALAPAPGKEELEIAGITMVGPGMGLLHHLRH